MTAFLPQYDPEPRQREASLKHARADYQYNHTYLSPLTMIQDVPFREEFSWKWLVHMGERVLRMVENHIEWEGDARLRVEHKERHGRFSDLVRMAVCDANGIVHVIKETLCSLPVEGRWTSMEDFAAVFRAIGLPGIAKDYQKDSVFAEMRLAGPNPLMLRQVKELDPRFPVSEDHFRTTLADDSLEAARQEGRLFLADFQILEGMENGFFAGAQKYVYAPLALFAVDKTTKQLVPIAIQCQQTPGPDNPIFTPDDEWNWLIAKTIVGIADGNYHEAIAHLGRTHLFIEPFVIATHRQLAPNHPLFLLLQPHFEGTLAINCTARKHLISDGGACDEMMGGSILATRGLAAKGVQSYDFDKAPLPLRLKAQGLDNAGVLPNYPYRDDALLYWDAIHQWVEDYLRLYYRGDADVREDKEVAAWFAELVSQEGGRIPGLNSNGSALTLDYLIEALTTILFHCSVQHAAVNFPQYDLMSYVPNMPLAGYTPAPAKKKGGTLGDYLALMPNRHATNLQVGLGFVLGSLHYTTLGQYGWRHFRDARVAAPLEAFEKRLWTIGKTIEQRNHNRRPYTFLVPSGVPQSINV
jgi:arachidonate 15-lipoxygenase